MQKRLCLLKNKSRRARKTKVDIGIALAHFKLGIEELSLKGHWEIENPNACDLEYIITWVSE